MQRPFAVVIKKIVEDPRRDLTERAKEPEKSPKPCVGVAIAELLRHLAAVWAAATMAGEIFAIRAAAPNITNRSLADFAGAEVAVYFFEDGTCHDSK